MWWCDTIDREGVLEGWCNSKLDKMDDVKLTTAVEQDLAALKNACIEIAKARDKAEQSVKFKTNFLISMSHELRTPLFGIIGFSRMLIESELSKEEQKKIFQIIYEGANKMKAIIDELFEMVNAETAKIESTASSV